MKLEEKFGALIGAFEVNSFLDGKMERLKLLI
jgi:hypothetical protein